jgi:peptidyl-prolyl cis-trans isomerase C
MLMKSRVLMIGAASVLALSACTKKVDGAAPASPATTAAAGATDNSVAATVNGTPIYSATVDMMVKERTAQGQPDSPELRKAIIDNLAMQTLVAAEGTKKGLDKAPETVRQLEILRSSVLAQSFVQDYIKTHPVTDAMVKAEYDKLNAKAGGNEYKARHILVATEAEANDIIAKLKKDLGSFAALAKAKSMDPGSKGNGGDLGWFNPAGMVPEFGAAVATLAKGKFTETPVKSQFGYHVIVLDDSRALTPPPLEQVSEQLKQQVQRQNLKTFFDDMKAKAKIVVVGAPAEAPAAAAAPGAAPAPAAVPAPAH